MFKNQAVIVRSNFKRVLKRNLLLNKVSQKFLPPEKQERAVNKKKHVQNNATNKNPSLPFITTL